MDALARHLATLDRSPFLFDEAFYLAEYPEIAELVRAGHYASGLDHYRRDGHADRQPHWLFDPARYRAAFPDLTPAALAAEGFATLYDHFLRQGAGEGRRGHDLFDPAFYRARHPHDPDAQRDPFGHYLAALASGAPEPRCTPYHDPDWYRAAYPEAAGQRGALHHYLTTPEPVRFDPLCDFSEADYAALHPDVRDAVRQGAFRNGYQHFLRHGIAELRQPARHIDLRHYAGHPAVRADLAAGRQPNAFAHLLQIGLDTGLSLSPAPPDPPQDEAAARALFLAQARALVPLYARDPLDFTLAGPPAVSVVMVLHNQFALTIQALASLRDHPGPIELLLVDNASTDETTGIGTLVRGARLLRFPTNVGFLRACNAALPHAAAPAVLYLNNDVRLAPGCLAAALRRLASDPAIGAVGGKVVRTHGLLQEAGCLLWPDGSAQGYLRDAPPNAPEANFVRDVAFCSGVFLLVRADLLRALGGFDDAFAPAYYEETDLCLRIRAAGFRVVYEPAAMLTHYEYASARSTRSAVAAMARGQRIFAAKHAGLLATLPGDRSRVAFARSVGAGPRVLFLEDTAPLRRIGSGFGRANDIVRAMAALGCQVTVFPIHGAPFPLAEMLADLPDTVELLHESTAAGLAAHLQDRRGCYDHVWVSRTHNLAHLQAAWPGGERGRLVLTLDTEAVVALRLAGQAALGGARYDLPAAMAAEFAGAAGCDRVVAVTAQEAALLGGLGLPGVCLLGHCRALRPTSRTWAARTGLLFVGAIAGADTPNHDGLTWFVRDVLPRVHELLGEAVPFRVAGHCPDGAILDHLRGAPGVELLGGAPELAPLYDAHRVFVAPTRFAAGAPYKVFEAASFGLPVAATGLLQGQLGWTDGVEVLAADHADPSGFARNVATLYRNEQAWADVRAAALARLRRENSPARFTDAVAGVLGINPPARPRAATRPRRAAAGSSAG